MEINRTDTVKMNSGVLLLLAMLFAAFMLIGVVFCKAGRETAKCLRGGVVTLQSTVALKGRVHGVWQSFFKHALLKLHGEKAAA